MTAPATPAEAKPPPVPESPDNPCFPSLYQIQSHLSNTYFTRFVKDENAFYGSQKNVGQTLGHAWQFANVDTLVLEDPSGGSYDGSTVFLRKCMHRLSSSCRLWAIRQRLRGEWHECCDACYEIYKKRKQIEKQNLEVKFDRVHRTDPSSRVPIAVL